MKVYLDVDEAGCGATINGGMRYPFTSIEQLEEIIVQAAESHRVSSTHDVIVLCSSSMDFPDEYTDAPETIALCEAIRNPVWEQHCGPKEPPAGQWTTNRTKYYELVDDDEFVTDMFSRLYTIIEPGGGGIATDQEYEQNRQRALELADELAFLLKGSKPRHGEMYT